MNEELTGKSFGHWTVLRRDIGSKWICQCKCGNICSVWSKYLKSGKSKQCKECRTKVFIASRISHGASRTRLYNIWNGMKQRCTNKNTKWYKNYGAKGIKVCDEWLVFENFYKWSMVNGYDKTRSIDRIDSSGNYEPSNCRWTDSVTQANNTSRNHFISYNGETHTLAEWSKISGISSGRISQRLKKGWAIEKAIFEKSYKGKNQFYKEV